MKNFLVITLKLLIAISFFVFAIQDVDFGRVGELLSSASVMLVVISTLILSLHFIVSTARWQAVLVALGISFGFAKTLRIIFISNFFNQLLPSSVGGDAVRIYKVHKAGLTVSTSINSVMLERLSTILGLFLMVTAFLPLFVERIHETEIVGFQWVLLFFAGCAFLGTGAIMLLDRLPQSLMHWRLVRGGAALARDTRTVFLHGSRTIQIVILAVIGQIITALSVWVLGLALSYGNQLTLIDCMVLVPLVILVTTIPVSIAGWGIREASMVTALGLIGIAPESALILSVLLGLQILILAVPGGIIWLVSPDKKYLET